MAGGGSSSDRSLTETPTWAVAAVCFAFVVFSLLLEMGIHHASHWLERRNKKGLMEALEKLKAELMLMGFISLLLTVGAKPISMICIPEKIAYTMLPCKKPTYPSAPSEKIDEEAPGRKRLWESMSSEQEVPWRRILAGAGESYNYCKPEKGYYPLVSPYGMNQLHYFIFLLAVLHVLFSVLTVGLARAKMRRWKAWEEETRTLDYEFSHDPARFRLTHETSFVRRHMNFWSQTTILKWIVCFFRQFCWSVTKVDYLTLRHGFIMAHLAPNSKFNFQKYIKRSLEDDFKSVVGISPSLWAFAIITLLLNVKGWHTFFWLSFVPFVIVLLVGAKLQVIITEMALEIRDTYSVVKGTPLVRPTNKLFWFGRPQLILFLIHFSLFQNAFQIAFFLWIVYQFGLNSCFHEKMSLVMSRIVIGVSWQLLCSYITFPLYALVTQMGSHMKRAIFEEQTANALQRWHKTAKKKIKQDRKSAGFTGGFTGRSGLRSEFQSGEATPLHGSSPLHLLRRYKTMGDINSPDAYERYYHSDNEASDLEMEASPSYPPQRTEPVLISPAKGPSQAIRHNPTAKDVDTHGQEFSFPL